VIVTLIRARFLLTLGVLYLMITKPDLATSLFILLGAIVVGLISAATAWTARPASLPTGDS
jgi:cell division protein FtsW (lipid II flippase)